ncbi:hypothetical protein [Methylophaga sp.]|uniref:hypothetical protein n=1 Tax=Methylophaga sp. TaxID=2024840 RepID=UPI00271EA0C3|nr:hypothetical protein [Methylophaga sp.]MDO8828137.1 hypothetical protein [Methylophaga sp.]
MLEKLNHQEMPEFSANDSDTFFINGIFESVMSHGCIMRLGKEINYRYSATSWLGSVDLSEPPLLEAIFSSYKAEMMRCSCST